MTFLGIDIGGTNIDIVLLNKYFRSIGVYSTKSNYAKLYQLIENLITQYKPKAIGIGAAMWFKNNRALNAPNLPKLIEMRDFVLNKPLFWENDANCFALYCSIKSNARNLLGITIGTGIGCGIIADGKILRGSGIACEIGHTFVGGKKKCVCGGYGHLECYFSGWSLKNPEKMIKDGRIYEIKGFNLLCRSIANAIMLLDPEIVAIGGRIGGKLSKDKLKDKIYSFLATHFEPEIEIVNDPLAVAKGACLLAKLSFQSR
ncbi:MAG: ROK family protein [Archaeoglobaceae archaeon]|nr:ROK family protein [Archaeoglobaceae archaeon]